MLSTNTRWPVPVQLYTSFSHFRALFLSFSHPNLPLPLEKSTYLYLTTQRPFLHAAEQIDLMGPVELPFDIGTAYAGKV